MSYTGSQTVLGKGTTVSIGGTPTLIGEVMKASGSGRKNAIISTTNLQSAAEEKAGGLPDFGSLQIEGNYVPADAGRLALEAAFASGAVTAFVLQLAKGPSQSVAGDKYAFNAIVADLNYDGFDPKSHVGFKATLDVTNNWTLTAGS